MSKVSLSSPPAYLCQFVCSIQCCPQAFEGVVRAHANATEFVPIFLIMLGLMEHLQVGYYQMQYMGFRYCYHMC